MRVAIGADHRGFQLKGQLLGELGELGHSVVDFGTSSTDPVDYPDFAETVGLAVGGGRADRGILVCGSGVGVSVAANKVPGIRAALCHDTYSARQGVEHDDMNVLVLGARVVGDALASELARAFLAARFSGEERHRRRLEKVRAIESRYQAQGGVGRTRRHRAPRMSSQSPAGVRERRRTAASQTRHRKIAPIGPP